MEVSSLMWATTTTSPYAVAPPEVVTWQGLYAPVGVFRRGLRGPGVRREVKHGVRWGAKFVIYYDRGITVNPIIECLS